MEGIGINIRQLMRERMADRGIERVASKGRENSTVGLVCEKN